MVISTVIVLLVLSGYAYAAPCSGSLCEWEPWEAWGSCSQTCGGETRYRSRELCCKLEFVKHVDLCLEDCGLDISGAHESGSCNQNCVHGHWDTHRCACPETYSGTCCSIRYAHACTGGTSMCEWTHWEAWGSCSRTCGGGSRHRSRRLCCEGQDTDDCLRACGLQSSGFYEGGSCNKNCVHGHWDTHICACPETYSGTCCTIRMCAWDRHYCWPGRCGGGLSASCSCADGFHGVSDSAQTTCQPDLKPRIETCGFTAIGPGGEKKMATQTGSSSKCQYKGDVFGNFQPVAVQYSYMAYFKVNVDISRFPKPDFVEEYMFGVTDASVTVQKRNIHGSPAHAAPGAPIYSDLAGNGMSARRTVSGGNDSIVVSGTHLNDGERLCLTYIAKGGGYVISKILASQSLQATVPYTKTETTKELCYRFDSTPPKHCKEQGTCTIDPIQIQRRIVRSPMVTMDFNVSDWFDPIPAGGDTTQSSGIQQLEITVNEVTGTKTLLKVTDQVSDVAVNASITSITLNLTASTPKLYCLTLTVKDVADNTKLARQFVLYDETSYIESRLDKRFYITSASPDTNYTWQTHTNICLDWKEHFYNKNYFETPVLGPIEEHPAGLIKRYSIYEQTSGTLPVSGTTNIDGIIGFKMSWAVNGGNLSLEETIPDFTKQNVCKEFNPNDGETYTIRIRAVDIVNNSYSKNRSVHIDRTVPHINRIGLMKDGYRRLFVHDMKDLAQMKLEFSALDPHSGVFEVHWTFGTDDGTNELDHGALSVKTVDQISCANSCYCPDVGLCEIYNYTISLNRLIENNKHHGDHNRNYYFTITVTNHARLSNTEHVDILVDDSPPEPGVVYEGPPEMPIDPRVEDVYTTSVNVSWKLGYHGGPGQIFVIQYSTDGETWTDGATLDTGNSTSRDRHSVTVDSLNPGTLYSLRIHAFNHHGLSLFTDVINVTTSTVAATPTSKSSRSRVSDSGAATPSPAPSSSPHPPVADRTSPPPKHPASPSDDVKPVSEVDVKPQHSSTVTVTEPGISSAASVSAATPTSKSSLSRVSDSGAATSSPAPSSSHHPTVTDRTSPPPKDPASPSDDVKPVAEVDVKPQHSSTVTVTEPGTSSAAPVAGADRRTSSSAVGPAVGGSAAVLIAIALVVGLVVLHKKGYCNQCKKKSKTYSQAAALPNERLTTTQVTKCTVYDELNITDDPVTESGNLKIK